MNDLTSYRLIMRRAQLLLRRRDLGVGRLTNFRRWRGLGWRCLRRFKERARRLVEVLPQHGRVRLCVVYVGKHAGNAAGHPFAVDGGHRDRRLAGRHARECIDAGLQSHLAAPEPGRHALLSVLEQLVLPLRATSGTRRNGSVRRRPAKLLPESNRYSASRPSRIPPLPNGYRIPSTSGIVPTCFQIFSFIWPVRRTAW